MKKEEGLKFLLLFFPDCTIDSSFVRNEDELNCVLKNKQSKSKFWRIRCANPNGSEFALPMGSFYDDISVEKFFYSVREKHPSFSFIFHQIDNNYYYPEYCGTLSVLSYVDFPEIIIELQKPTPTMIDSMDLGTRPRDWPVSLLLRYLFLNPFTYEIYKNGVEIEEIEKIKLQIKEIYDIGIIIYDYYKEHGWFTTSYTRFNLCRDGTLVLNDHRSNKSFGT